MVNFMLYGKFNQIDPSMNVCNYDISQYTHNLYEHDVPYQIIYRT